MQRAQVAESTGDGEGAEELRECKLNEDPFDPSVALPSQGILQVVYFSTLQQDAMSIVVEVDLAQANGRAILLRLWERALTTPTDYWAGALHNSSPVTYDEWLYPCVPESGLIALTYCVRLAIKPYDRGVFFSKPMTKAAFASLNETLCGRGQQQCSDFDKVNLIKQASMRNYFTSIQVKALIDTVCFRKGKIEAAVLLHPRTTDQSNFPHALRSLDKDSDRQDILEMVGASISRKSRRAMHAAAKASQVTTSLAALSAASATSVQKTPSADARE